MKNKKLILYVLSFALIFSSIPFLSFAGEDVQDGSKENPYLLTYDEKYCSFWMDRWIEDYDGKSEVWCKLDSKLNHTFNFSVYSGETIVPVTGAELYKDSMNNKIGTFAKPEYETDDYFEISKNQALTPGTYYIRIALNPNSKDGERLDVFGNPDNNGYWSNLSKTEYVYDGKAKKPSVTIYNENDEKLPIEDFDIKYYDNVKVGYPTVVISSEKYSYLESTGFSIIPKGTNITRISGTKKGFKVSWKKQTIQTTGYKIRYSTKANMNNFKEVIVKGKSKTSKTITKLKSNKKYYVQVCAYNSGYFMESKWTPVKKVTTK